MFHSILTNVDTNTLVKKEFCCVCKTPLWYHEQFHRNWYDEHFRVLEWHHIWFAWCGCFSTHIPIFLYLYAIILTVLPRFTDSEYPLVSSNISWNVIIFSDAYLQAWGLTVATMTWLTVRNICVTNDHECFHCYSHNPGFPQLWLVTEFLTSITRRMLLVQEELPTPGC